MPMTPNILIAGATGATGSATIAALASSGHEYTALLRRRSDVTRLAAVPTTIAEGDLDDETTMAAALRGIDAAYLVTPSSERAEQQQIRFVELAAEAGVSRIVLLSQLGAAIDSPVRFLRYHAVVEARLAELGIPTTIIRPNLFFQGLLAMREMITHTGTLVAPIGDARVSAVDVRDIGEVAATALLDSSDASYCHTLTGPDAITHREMAESLAESTGSTIGFQDVDPSAFADALQGVLPTWQIDGLLEDYAHYRRGEAAYVTDTVAAVTGHPARGFTEFAADHAHLFRRGGSDTVPA
ncbi:SDR family oxidoreductase [Williamsia herbipolensis]|uniref:SDR family oxidoreductase n=1 Tax=Williamsia herbipolensis TaxID=1603258 RepID=A0AAU4JZ10_9NOCA|nr:SDR family oxidoreductase [Williamsia herbipolensis]